MSMFGEASTIRVNYVVYVSQKHKKLGRVPYLGAKMTDLGLASIALASSVMVPYIMHTA